MENHSQNTALALKLLPSHNNAPFVKLSYHIASWFIMQPQVLSLSTLYVLYIIHPGYSTQHSEVYLFGRVEADLLFIVVASTPLLDERSCLEKMEEGEREHLCEEERREFVSERERRN